MRYAFYKYFWKIFPRIIIVAIIAPIAGNFQYSNVLKATLFALAFSIVFSLLMSILEVTVIRNYYTKLNLKISRLFESTILSPNLNKVNIGKYEVYILINSDNYYTIEFHIPRSQINKMKHKPDFDFKNYTLDKIDTYKIAECSSLFLKRTKKIIIRKIEAVSKYK